MKKISRLKSLIVLAVICVAAVLVMPQFRALMASQSAGQKEYVCPPCGCSKDNDVFEQPGYCPSCGMALVEKGSAASQPQTSGPQVERKKVAILIFDGVQIIDYT